MNSCLQASALSLAFEAALGMQIDALPQVLVMALSIIGQTEMLCPELKSFWLYVVFKTTQLFYFEFGDPKFIDLFSDWGEREVGGFFFKFNISTAKKNAYKLIKFL